MGTQGNNPIAIWGNGLWGSGTWGSEPYLSLPAQYYLNLFTSEYRTAPKLNAFLQLLITPLQDMAQCLELFGPSFDVSYATGVQLDLVGSIAGASRTVEFQPSNSVSPVLDDATYRIYIQAKIARNQWDGQLDSLQTIWQTLFPGGRLAISDGMNMSATVLIYGSFSSIIEDLITNGYLVPRPEAVQYTYSILTTPPAFGFDQNNALIAGWDLGHWT